MILAYILIAVFVLADFLLKFIFSSIYSVNQVEEIIPGILKLGYIQNTGASFGILDGQQFLFFLITLVALGVFGYFFSKADFKTKPVYTIAFTFLISGTLGNAIDRLLYGYVKDFIQLPFLPFVGNTYFNLADALLNVGIVLLVIELLILETLRAKKAKTNHPKEEKDEEHTD